MKRIICTLLFLSLSVFVFGQSITLSPTGPDELQITTFGGGGAYPSFLGRNAGGISSSPTATPAAYILSLFGGRGYTGTSFTTSTGAITFDASQQFTTSALGTHIRFHTTPINSTTLYERMRIAHNGNVGIGTNTPDAKLEVAGTYAVSGKTTFTGTQHNYNLGGKSVIYVNGGTSLLTGIAGGSDGMIVHIYVDINTDLTIADQSTSSLAANRIITGHSGDMTILSGGGATLIYDGDVSSWRVIGWKA